MPPGAHISALTELVPISIPIKTNPVSDGAISGSLGGCTMDNQAIR